MFIYILLFKFFNSSLFYYLFNCYTKALIFLKKFNTTKKHRITPYTNNNNDINRTTTFQDTHSYHKKAQVTWLSHYFKVLFNIWFTVSRENKIWYLTHFIEVNSTTYRITHYTYFWFNFYFRYYFFNFNFRYVLLFYFIIKKNWELVFWVLVVELYTLISNISQHVYSFETAKK